MQMMTRIIGTRPSPITRFFFNSFAALLTFVLSMALLRFFDGLMARSPVLGWIGVGLFAAFILATLAMAALKNWHGSRAAAAGFAGSAPSMAAGQIEPAQLAAMTSPETEQLVLRAMISAAKADGEVDEDEIQRIVGKIGEDGVSMEERQFVAAELRRPLDLASLVAAVPNQAIAAQVYGASILAIRLDTEAELAYLRQLARGLGLDAETVARLHQLTGVQA